MKRIIIHGYIIFVLVKLQITVFLFTTYEVHSVIHVSVYVCMYLWMDGWIDGWTDGCHTNQIKAFIKIKNQSNCRL